MKCKSCKNYRATDDRRGRFRSKRQLMADDGSNHHLIKIDGTKH